MGFGLYVSYRRNMESICITMEAMKREQFRDYGKSMTKGEDTTVHLTRLNPNIKLDFMCILDLLFIATVKYSGYIQ
jgi:hypothetical protein